MICVVVCEQHAADLPAAIARAAELADIVELRLDCLLDASVNQLKEVCLRLMNTVGNRLIVTLRSADEGGHQEIAREQRLDFWRSMIGTLTSAKNVFVDIESDLVRDLRMEADFCAAVDWQQVICSYHDFSGMPHDLNSIYDQLKPMPAHVIKIAARADDATDCIPMFHLLQRARLERRQIIPIAMGSAGLATRVLGPSRDAFLTYASVAAEHATAPGQVTAKDLIELYRVRQISPETRVFGLIGSPVSHSISPQIHNAAFSFTRTNAVYLPLQVRDAGDFIRRLLTVGSREVDLNLCGLSVTAPHKSSVIEYLDWIEPDARRIGAVNTIVIRSGYGRTSWKDGDYFEGYNTDASAFRASLYRAGARFKGLSVAVIGAGGAARTAVWSLLNARSTATVFARDVKATKWPGAEFGIDCKPLEGAAFSDYDLVVNATPVGTRGELQGQTVATAEQLRGVRLVYDLVYNPTETLLLKEAARAGCQVIGGLEMLLAQAAEQFELWTRGDAPLEVMRAAAERALSEPPAVAGGPNQSVT